MTLTTHHLEFTATALTPLELDAQSGSQVRGALVGALWGRFCANKAAPACAACPLLGVCPVAQLVAPLRDDPAQGGDQLPRPYVIQPPVGGPRRLRPGDALTFGLRLFGSVSALFPYVVMAAREIEESGMGRPLAANNGRRGRLRLASIDAVHPLGGLRQRLYQAGEAQVRGPGLPVAPDEVRAFAERLPADALTLDLLTPLRLIDADRLVKRLSLRPLVQRLLRRLEDLCAAYGEPLPPFDYRALVDAAGRARVARDDTRWVDVVSSSSRQGGRTPIGGLVGSVAFEGELAPLREMLVWGSLVHVGKNAVKGDGWYRLVYS